MLEAFALNALEPDEMQTVEQHLASCDGCSETVEIYHDSLAQLSLAAQDVDPIQAPSHLKQNIFDSISPPESASSPKLTFKERWQWLFGSRLMPTLVTVQAAIILVLGGVLWQQSNSSQQSDVVMLEQAMDLMLHGTNESRFLAATDDAPDGSWGRLYTRPDMDVVVVLMADTPAAPDNAEYRFWFRDGDEYIEAGVLHMDSETSRGRGWLVTPKPEQFDGVMVTMDSKGSTTNSPNGPIMLAASYPQG
jgi:hypothetical protein